MGTTVSSLQILGAAEEDVRAVLPYTLVGKWSERFVTACPDLSFRTLERKAGLLSKKLACTVLSVSMFDGDTLSLVLYQNGKRLTRHVVDPEVGECVAGNPKLFCTGLDLPEELAPKLKRLFTACPMQEEKLGIFQNLLGAPLFVRSDLELPTEVVRADSAPLEDWYRDHPAPPKLKNQCKAEVIQEIPEKIWSCTSHQSNIPILCSPSRFTEEDSDFLGRYFKVGDVLGESLDGAWARPMPDGHLERILLARPEVTPEQYRAILHKEPPDSNYVHLDYNYVHLGDRVITTANLFEPNPIGGGNRPVQTVILHDTAGILPCPLPLVLENAPALLAFSYPPSSIQLLPDGGFLAAISPLEDDSCPPVRIREPALVRYAPDGIQRWVFWGMDQVVQVTADRIYACPSCPFVLNMDGEMIAKSSVVYPYNTKAYVLNGVLYLLESRGYRQDDLLHRLTPDLRPDGEVPVPGMASLAFSPDGTLLYAAGYESGLRVIDAVSMEIICDLHQKANYEMAVADGQNRLWVSYGSYLECYTSKLECISRHRLTGEICGIYRNEAGQVCADTSQRNKCIIRVYRFS